MNQMRHNFVKTNSLIIQIIDFLKQNSTNILSPNICDSIQYEIHKSHEKYWQSATYDGAIHHYGLTMILPNPHKRAIDMTATQSALNHAIGVYEFAILRSFVVDIKIKNLKWQSSQCIDMEIEVHIINEE